MSILLDAGPTLNFLAVGQENCLIQYAKSTKTKLATPERVDREIRGKAKAPRFVGTPVATKWPILAGTHVKILDDTLSSQLFTDAVARISGVPAHQRVRDSASLGEIMAIAHASILVQAGEDVMLLIDETDGTRRAGQEWKHLQRLGVTTKLRLGTTTRLLKAAAAQDWIKGGLTRDQVYRQMTNFDDGLPKQPDWGAPG